MNLVVGATGILGSEICRQLAEAGKPVRALVRKTSDSAKVERLRKLGAEIVVGDLKDPASIEAACQGAKAVLSTATTTLSRQPGDTIQTVDRQGQLGLVDAATRARVEHFTFVSARIMHGPMAEYMAETELSKAKWAVEERIISSGIPYTIILPNCIEDVWVTPMMGFDYVNGKAMLYGSGEGKASFVSLSDVARLAVASLDQRSLRDVIVEIGGPEDLSWMDVVRIFEEETGRRFEVTHVPREAVQAQLEAARNNPNASDLDVLFPQFGLLMIAGFTTDMRETLERFPMHLTSVREYAKRVAPALVKA